MYLCIVCTRVPFLIISSNFNNHLIGTNFKGFRNNFSRYLIKILVIVVLFFVSYTPSHQGLLVLRKLVTIRYGYIVLYFPVTGLSGEKLKTYCHIEKYLINLVFRSHFTTENTRVKGPQSLHLKH